jgi:hypothetical protein
MGYKLVICMSAMAAGRLLIGHPRYVQWRHLRTQVHPGDVDQEYAKRPRPWTEPGIMRYPELEFDKVAAKQYAFRMAMQVQELLARHPERLVDIIELETRNPKLAAVVRAYPGVFKVLDYWQGKKLVCFTAEAESVHKQEEGLKAEIEMRSVGVLQKLLMLSVQRQLPLRRIGMLAMDLGLPGDFQQDLLGRFGHVFRLSTRSDYITWLSLVATDPELAVSCAEVQHKQRRPGMYV